MHQMVSKIFIRAEVVFDRNLLDEEDLPALVTKINPDKFQAGSLIVITL